MLILITFCLTQFLQAQPAAPKFDPFQSVSPSRSQQTTQTQLPGRANPLLSNDPYTEQNTRALQQAGMVLPGVQQTNRQQQLMELKNELKEEAEEENKNRRIALSIPFQNNFQQFLQLSPDSFSISKAVYLSESAYFDNPPPPSFQQFQASLQQAADLVRQILKKEGLDEKDNTAVLYGIQKLYTQANSYYNAKTRQTVTIEKLRYDFDDYIASADYIDHSQPV